MIPPYVLTINYINRHLALKNILISYRIQNTSYLRNLELAIISSQSKLVDIQILRDKNDFVHVVTKDVLEMNFITCSSVQNSNH